MSFYRGVWCPYCNLELQALEAARAEIEARGACLIAVSMQNAANSAARLSGKDSGSINATDSAPKAMPLIIPDAIVPMMFLASNENKMSDRHRERAWLWLKLL